MQVAERKRVQVSDYLRSYIYPGAELDVYVNKDPAALMRRTLQGPVVPVGVPIEEGSLNRELVNLGLAEENEEQNTLVHMASTNIVQQVYGSFIENLFHRL